MTHKYISRGTSVSVLFLIFLSFNTFAQVGIGTTDPDSNALLDIDATNTPGGLLLPRVNLVAINNPSPLVLPIEAGMTVYNLATAGSGANAVTPGFYYHDGTTWVRIGAGAADPNDKWSLTGNTGTIPNTNFLGTIDNQPLKFRTVNADRFEITGGVATSRGRLRAFDNGSATEPTYSWNSNIGTGMFQQAANVLGFSTAGTERMRILADGRVAVNTITPFAGDRFTVQGAANEYAINGLTSGVGVAGVYGENATTGGYGVFGNAAGGYGVLGQSTGAGRGVSGSNNSTGFGVIGFGAAGGVGVQGQNSGAGTAVVGISGTNGVGVHGESGGNGDGVNGMVSGTGDGVYGQNTGSGNAVHGLSSSTGFGVKATSWNNTGTALRADGANWRDTNYLPSTGISASGDEGLFAWGKNLMGTGVLGTGNGSFEIVTNISGGGIAGSGTRNGVFGYAGIGSRANGNRGNAGGIFMLDTDNNIANNNSNNNNGIRATAILAGFDNIAFNGNPTGSYSAQDSYFGGYFSGGTQRTGAFPTAYAYVGLRYNAVATGLGDATSTDFKIVGPGIVSTLINDYQNVPRIMFAPEAPEIVFQDYGIGQLVNGEANIALDPILKKSLHIDSKHPLKVFVTLEGDCNGVYVTNKSADGFTVKELQNGKSNVPFSWQIVANRADTKDRSGNVVSKHVGLRLPVGPGAIYAEAKQLELETVDQKDAIKESRESVSENFKGRQLNSSAQVSEASVSPEAQSQTPEGGSTSPSTISEPSTNTKAKH